MKLYLVAVRLDSGGYDCFGQYFGNVVGTRVYRWDLAWDLEPSLTGARYPMGDSGGSGWGYVRAVSREAAKAKLREQIPSARFFR